MENMETNDGPATRTLIDRLISKPHGFNLFQAISLLERAQPHASAIGTRDGTGEAVRLKAFVTLGFPGSDVYRVGLEPQTKPRYTLSTGVLTLAGQNAPLPVPFTEMVIARTAARDGATADFLDIFNHRFLSFLYRGRKKHFMGLNWQAPQTTALASSLDNLSALGLKAGIAAPGGERAWLRHAGLLAGAPRSMSGLMTLLSDRFGVRVTGRQFQGAWRPLAEQDQSLLSGGIQAPRLGESAVLGRRVWDQAAGVVLEIHDLSQRQLQSFLPGQSQHTLLTWLVRRYVQQDMGVELVLHPKAAEKHPLILGGGDSSRLGWTSWILTSAAPADGKEPCRFALQEHAGVPAAH